MANQTNQASGKGPLPPEALTEVAAYFQALAEPTRLHLLNLLRDGEHSVNELAQLIGSSAANASRHLALLQQRGLIARETRGNSVYYRIADPTIDALCELVCGSIGERLKTLGQKQVHFTGARRPAAGKRRAG